MTQPPPRPRLVVVAGPTAAGKTGAAIALAEAFGGEIISADAVAVYRRLDIGTAKPTPEEMARVPHHLVDILEPDEPYDAALFAKEAGAVIERLHSQGKTAFVAGGTGFYIKALLRGLFEKGRSDPALRDRLREEADRLGPQALHQRLAQCDPKAAERIHSNDAFRIVRALEIFELTGEPISAWQEDHGFAETPYDALLLCLVPDREELYQRINTRVDRMMEQGFLDEVKGLLDMGFDPELKSLRSLGYRHMGDHLLGKTDLEEAVRLMKRDTRRFAKRQLTWFNSEPAAVTLHPKDLPLMRQLTANHLKTD